MQQRVEPKPATSGDLTLTVVDAMLTRNTELIGKMDPWVKIATSTQNFRTKTMRRAGKTPFWNQSFRLSVRDTAEEFSLEVYDEDPRKDDLIGSARIKFAAVCLPNAIEQMYTITYQGQSAGQVRLRAQFTPSKVITVETVPEDVNFDDMASRFSQTSGRTPRRGFNDLKKPF